MNVLTNVMSFIKNNYGLLGELLGDHICDLWVQEVVVTVDYDVGMEDLPGVGKGRRHQRKMKSNTQRHNNCNVFRNNMPLRNCEESYGMAQSL